MSTRVIHIADIKHNPDAVYIGRANGRAKLKASPFANPYKLKHIERGLAIDMYEENITRGEMRHLLADLPSLRGKPLACWCRREGVPWSADKWCHGDVLVGLLDEYTDEELRAMAKGGDHA